MTEQEYIVEYAKAVGEFVATGGGTVRLLLADEEAMAYLDTRVTDSGYSLAEHIRCCTDELDKVNKMEQDYAKEQK